jgi:hypothetical protein
MAPPSQQPGRVLDAARAADPLTARGDLQRAVHLGHHLQTRGPLELDLGDRAGTL